MFDHDVDYPTAVASYDDEGVAAAIEWSVGQMEDGSTLSVWTSLKSNLQNCPELQRLVQRHHDVEHITGRGGTMPAGPGPVLMAWADMGDIGELVRYSRGIRALCVITWNEDRLRPWVAAMKPDILGDGSAWADLRFDLDPIVIEALKGWSSRAPRGSWGYRPARSAWGSVDIDERHLIRPVEQSGDLVGQAGEQACRDGVELLDVTVRERPQIRAQCRRRPHPGEQLAHRPVSEQVEVVDAVRAGEHACDDAARLYGRVRRIDTQPLVEQVVQAGGLGQSHHRHQPCGRHEVRVIENGRDGVRCFHLRDASVLVPESWCGNSDSPALQGLSRSTTRSHRHITGGSGLR